MRDAWRRLLLARGGSSLLVTLEVVGRVRNLDLDQFVAYVESRPLKLMCWQTGALGQYPTLAWLNVYPVVEQASLAKQVGHFSAASLTTQAFHNQGAIAADWVLRRDPPGRGRGRPSPHDYLKSSGRRPVTTSVSAISSSRGTRVGTRGFESHGSSVSLPYEGNPEVDALDRVFDLIERSESAPRDPPRRDDRLVAWYASGGRDCPWHQSPIWVQAAFRSLTAAVMSQLPTYLSPDVSVAGFTLGELSTYWCELTARAMHAHTAAPWGSTNLPTVAPVYGRDEFVEAMAANAGIPQGAADRITALLTMDTSRCPDPALTPLVPLDHQLLPMQSLIMPASPQRNTLAIMQSDPAAYGEIGRLLGMAGERATLDCLRRMSPDTLVVARVRVVRPNGTWPGDLDVVVCDPGEQLIVVFEIKWHRAADGNTEVYKMERLALDKRTQVVRLRSEIESGGAAAQWPQHWRDVTGFKWHWYVLTRDVLATRHITESRVTLRSHQLLERMLRRDATVAASIFLTIHRFLHRSYERPPGCM